MFLTCVEAEITWNKMNGSKGDLIIIFLKKEGLMNICKRLKNVQLTEFKCESNRFTARKKFSGLRLFLKISLFCIFPFKKQNARDNSAGRFGFPKLQVNLLSEPGETGGTFQGNASLCAFHFYLLPSLFSTAIK